MNKLLMSVFITMIFVMPTYAKINLYGLYDFSSLIEVEGSGSGINGTIDYSMSSGFGFGVEYEDKLQDKLGYIAGAAYYLQRETDEVKISGGGSSVTSPLAKKGRFDLALVYANLTYNIDDQKQIYAGLNYPFPSYDVNNTSAADVTLTGSFGYQFGGVYKFSEKLSVDATYQFINMTAKIDADSSVLDYDTAKVNGIRFSVKYSLD